jgi:arylsulfatase
MKWPNGIKPSRQPITEPGHFIDMMATFVGISGAIYPSEVNGRSIRPMQGKNLIPLLNGKIKGFDRTLYWEHEGNQAVRRGRWKLVRKFPGQYELYDIEADRTESHDRGGDQPKIVAELKRSWDTWAKDSGVLPWEQVEKSFHDRSA